MTRTKPDIFKTKIHPVIEKLVALCEKYNMPMHFVMQLGEKGIKTNLFTQSLFRKSDSDIFGLMTSITKGEYQIFNVERGNVYLHKNDSIADPIAVTEMTRSGNAPLVLPFDGRIH